MNYDVINWGCSTLSPPPSVRVFNPAEKVAVALNKLSCFSVLERNRVSTPEFTREIETARLWASEGSAVFQRTLLEASEGRGITVADRPVDIVQAKLYTKAVKKKREYRVHVAFGRVIGYKRKIKAADTSITGDRRVRSYANGYRFIIDAEHPPAQVILDEALRAMQALELDFGGVDVMWTETNNRAYVLEVNTAPGMTPITVEWYANAFRSQYNV